VSAPTATLDGGTVEERRRAVQYTMGLIRALVQKRTGAPRVHFVVYLDEGMPTVGVRWKDALGRLHTRSQSSGPSDGQLSDFQALMVNLKRLHQNIEESGL